MKKFFFIAFVLFAISFSIACSKNSDNNQNKPFITILGSNPTNWALSVPYTDPGAEAFDVTSTGDTVNITSSLIVTDNVNVMLEGSYEVNFNVTDTDGNKAEERTRVVNVVLGK